MVRFYSRGVTLTGMDSKEAASAGLRPDAARNRRRLLDAAADIVASRGADALTMDELARHAGVGKGTVFRRFGTRGGLMQALLDHAEEEFSAAYRSGPPPLGPGAAPAARLLAFGPARIASLHLNGELARAAELDPRTRYHHPSRRLAREHLTELLRHTGAVPDPEVTAYQLLAFLDASLLLHLREAGVAVERLEDGWTGLVSALMRN